MPTGAGLLDDSDSSTNTLCGFRRVPPPLKGVGHAFLDDSDDGDQDNPPVSKSLILSPTHNLLQVQNEQTVHEGRFESEFMYHMRLGRGGFGSVFLVKNKLDGGFYAIKKIRFKRRRKDGKLGSKILREIRAMNALSHPGIVRYHGSWIEDDVSPHGTPTSSSERHVKLFELNDEDEGDEEEEEEEGERDGSYEEGDELGAEEEESEAGVVNADEDEEDDKGSSTTNTEERSISGVAPFEMEEDEDDDEKGTHRGRLKKKESFESPGPWTYGTLYIQMQYYETTLEAWLDSAERKNHVCVHVSRDIFMQIVEALHYIHSKGYIHRDLKPANIFLTPRKDSDSPVPGDVCKCEICGKEGCGLGFSVSIGDFGLTTFSQNMKPTDDSEFSPPQAKGRAVNMSLRSSDGVNFLSDIAPLHVPVPSSLSDIQPCAASVGCLTQPRHGPSTLVRSRSRSGSRNSPRSLKHTTGVGSMSYASPEQIGKHFYDEKTDIFSLGIICYQLFSPPFSTRMERAKVFEKLRAGEIPQWFIDAHPKEAELIRSCLAEDPAARPSTSDILGMDIWEPAPCIYLRDSSYAVTIPRAMFKRMQDDITRLQQELAATKEQLAKVTGRPVYNLSLGAIEPGRLPQSPRRGSQLSRTSKTPRVSELQRNSDLPSLF